MEIPEGCNTYERVEIERWLEMNAEWRDPYTNICLRTPRFCVSQLVAVSRRASRRLSTSSASEWIVASMTMLLGPRSESASANSVDSIDSIIALPKQLPEVLGRQLTPDSLQSSDYVATAEKLLREAEHTILSECGARRPVKAWMARSASMQEVRDSIDAGCLDNVKSAVEDHVSVQLPGREQRSCPHCFTSCLSSGLLLLAGISPKPGRCQTVLLIAVLCLASIRAASCWAKMFSHETYGFSSLECTIRAFQSTCALALIAQAHRRGLAELVTKQIRSAAGDDFMEPWMDNQKSIFAVILAYLLLHFLHAAASYRLLAHCDPSAGLSSLCVECAGGLFHAGLAHCTLHLNSFLMHYMDFFARVCRHSTISIGKAETTWTCVAEPGQQNAA
eukprot:s5688_g2.t1